jgi:TonB family protein
VPAIVGEGRESERYTAIRGAPRVLRPKLPTLNLSSTPPICRLDTSTRENACINLQSILSSPLSAVSFTAILRPFPLLAAVFLLLIAAPLRAQERAAVHKVPPTYPPIARQMGITGTVIVTTTVDATGKVVKAESTSGNKLLAASAIDAVKQWKFAPGDGPATFPVSVNFEKQ